MRILDNGLIRDRYDVIVVGSGIGGLTAAALLAKRGVNTLVLEQHYLPGGACTTMRRQGITFDVGVAMMFGFGQQGFNPHLFVMNELEEELEVIPHDCLYRMYLKDREITFWREIDRYLAELEDLFPHHKKELRKLYDFLQELYANTLKDSNMVVPPSEMPAKDGMKLFMKNPLGMLKTIPLMYKNTASLLEKFLTDPDVLAFFNMLTCTYFYCDAQETPASMAAPLFCDLHEAGAFYPSGSPQMLSNKLEKAIEKNGGQLLYGKMVDEVLISHGRAYGVRLDDGTEIMADRVVANGTIWNLYGKLVKHKHIKPKQLDWAQGFIPTFGSLVIYLGVDAEVIPEGMTPILMLVEDMYNITGNDITVYISSVDDPTLCPPGTHTVTIIQPSLSKWPRPWEPAYSSEEYSRQKQEEADKLLDQVEKHIPNLRKHTRVMEVATPTTIERFTLKNWGAVGGPKGMMGQEMMNRLKARSEWKNLYLCGDSTVMGIGIPATTVSGVGAANMVLRDLGYPEYAHRSFDQQYIKQIKGKPWTPPPPPGEPLTEDSAQRLARDCQHCEKPACQASCPAGIYTCNFARRIEAGNFAGAARVLRETNPLSEICGYICPSERFCEKECTRLDFTDKPMRIRELHGWVCGHVSPYEGWDPFVPAAKGPKVAVVGAGPAGLTCAHYLTRLGYQVDILDKAKEPGGMPSRAVPAFRLPEEVVAREIAGLTLPGMNFLYGQALGRDYTVSDLQKDHRAVFLAPGLWSSRRLKIPGLDKTKVTDGLRFLCSSRTKGKAKVGKHVLVIGGGSVAAETALTARHSGADQVTLVCLEREEEMPCLPSEINHMKSHGIGMENGWGPREVSAGGELTLVRCTSVFAEEGRFRPVFDDSETKKLRYDQVILAVGQTLEPALAKYLKKDFGSKEQLEVEEETMQVIDRPGIFAGGDIVRGAGTVVQAVADGRRAAMAISNLLG